MRGIRISHVEFESQKGNKLKVPDKIDGGWEMADGGGPTADDPWLMINGQLMTDSAIGHPLTGIHVLRLYLKTRRYDIIQDSLGY